MATEVPALLRGPAHPAQASERVLVAFDGSRAARCALRHALAKRTAAHVQIALLNVQPPIMAGDVTVLTSAGAIEENRRRRGMAVLSPAVSLLEAHRVSNTVHVVLGDVAEEIAKNADRLACTRIVMGTRALSALRSLFSRSVAQSVVKRTKVPVTLVKAAAAAPRSALPLPAPSV